LNCFTSISITEGKIDLFITYEFYFVKSLSKNVYVEEIKQNQSLVLLHNVDSSHPLLVIHVVYCLKELQSTTYFHPSYLFLDFCLII